MFILASVLLALTIRQSHRRDIPRWRSSALAVMEHGMCRSQERLNNRVVTSELDKISELEVWAWEVKVGLTRTGRFSMDIGLIHQDSLEGRTS